MEGKTSLEAMDGIFHLLEGVCNNDKSRETLQIWKTVITSAVDMNEKKSKQATNAEGEQMNKDNTEAPQEKSLELNEWVKMISALVGAGTRVPQPPQKKPEAGTPQPPQKKPEAGVPRPLMLGPFELREVQDTSAQRHADNLKKLRLCFALALSQRTDEEVETFFQRFLSFEKLRGSRMYFAAFNNKELTVVMTAIFPDLSPVFATKLAATLTTNC